MKFSLASLPAINKRNNIHLYNFKKLSQYCTNINCSDIKSERNRVKLPSLNSPLNLLNNNSFSNSRKSVEKEKSKNKSKIRKIIFSGLKKKKREDSCISHRKGDF